MSEIRIDTTQNVTIDLPLASVGDRIIAYLLDLIFICVYFFSAVIVMGLLQEPIIMLFFFIPVLFYSLLFESFMGGQTPGKRVMKIHVCNLDGSPTEFSSFLLRWMFRLVDFSLTNGLCAILCIVIGEKGQRLGDILAKTTVVKSKSAIRLDSTILCEVEDDYQVVFPQVEQLKDKDIELFQEVIQKLKGSDDYVRKLNFGLKARNKIAENLGIKTEMEPLVFFKTLMKDYNSIHKKC